jgi:hypothetical protein
MRRTLLALGAALLLIGPVRGVAQVNSPGAASERAKLGLGTAALHNTGTSGANVPLLNTQNHWGAYQVIGLNPVGTVNPRINVGLQVVGPASGENNVVDAFSYNGASQFVAERYGWNGKAFTPVQRGENIGGYWGAAFDGKGDPVDAGLTFNATENQTLTANGMDAEIWYTPNGSTALTEGFAVNAGGLGGVTVGGGSAGRPGLHPKDLGNGTINAADSIVTMNHFRTSGSHGTVTRCGANPTLARGTDQAGAIATGGAVTSCTYNFAKSWGGPPVCMVQIFNAATPAPYISSELASSITVSFPAPFNGVFQYMCMGVG